MRVAIIGDTHFGARTDSLTFNNYFHKFFEKIFLPYLIQHDIKKIIHLGDVFDRRKYVNYHILSESRKVFNKLETLGIQMDIIIGNHDTYWKNTNDVNSPNLLLGEYKNINVYPKATEVLVGSKKVLYVPWITDESEEETLRFIDSSKSSLCFGHLELNNYQVMPGVYHDSGLSPDVFKKFNMVLSGHFHTRQSRDNIHYLGCPYQINYSDLNEIKGFHILDIETEVMEFIPNPYQMFYKIIYDDKDKTFENLVHNMDFHQFQYSYIKVIVVNKTDVRLFEKFMDHLQSFEPMDIKTFEDYATIYEIDLPTDIQMLTSDTLSVLHDSVDSLTSTSDKDILKLLLKEIYVIAQNMED